MTASAKRKTWQSDSSHPSANSSVTIMAGWSLQIFNTDTRWCIRDHSEEASFRNYSRFQPCLSDESMQSWTRANKHQGRADGVPDTPWLSCSLALSSCVAFFHLHACSFVPVREPTVSGDFTVTVGFGVWLTRIISSTVNSKLRKAIFFPKQSGRKCSEENGGETNTPHDNASYQQFF